MRIDSRINPPYLVQITRPAQAASGAAPPREVPQQSYDRVQLSAQSRELARLKKDLEALPDLRPDRVALARQEVKSGYRVDPVLLAQKMLKEQPLQGDDL